MEPAARELQLRPSQRIVQALAEAVRRLRRVLYSIASACKRAQRLDRRTPSCKSSAAQADANAVARAPQTVRDSTKAVVPLVLDELQAWPARRVMLICAARSGAEAVRVAIRPSTVHAELQTLCSNPHWLIPPHS